MKVSLSGSLNKHLIVQSTTMFFCIRCFTNCSLRLLHTPSFALFRRNHLHFFSTIFTFITSRVINTRAVKHRCNHHKPIAKRIGWQWTSYIARSIMKLGLFLFVWHGGLNGPCLYYYFNHIFDLEHKLELRTRTSKFDLAHRSSLTKI